MADVVNERYAQAQALIEVRAKKLNELIKKTNGKSFPKRAAFDEGVKHLQDLIENESKLLDTAIFDIPETSVVQMRNLHLTTGHASQTVPEGMKSATDAMDAMLKALTEMAEQR